MKKVIVLLPIVWLCLPLLAKIPLEKAIERGIQKSRVIQNNKLEQAALKLEKKKRKLQKWFTLHLGGSYLFKSQQMEINLSDIQINPGISIAPDPIIVGAKHNYDLKVSLTQPLYTGHRLSNFARLKGIQLEMEQHNTTLNTIDIVTRIKISYFTYRMLMHKQESLNTYLETLRLHQQRLEDFYREELIKKSDLLETEIRLQEQMLSLEEIKLLITREKINFKSLCDTGVEDINSDYTEVIETIPGLFSDFQSKNPYMKLLNAQIRHLEIQKKMARADTLPRLAGFAEIHYGRPGIDYFSNDWSLYFQGGLSFDLKLFDWNQQTKDQKILSYDQEKSKNKKEDFSQEVRKQVGQLLESKRSTETKLSIIRNLIDISSEEAQLKEELFQEQQISNKEYLASLATKESYRAREKDLQVQVEIIKVNINKLLGLLPEKPQEEK